MGRKQATVDPAFYEIPDNSTFFMIWRIEDYQVAPIPQELYGNFYDGDSYIVATTYERKGKVDATSQPHEVKDMNTVDTHIHLWLGSKTSNDEMTVAANKAIELDEYLGGSPVQHREVEGHESLQFRGYFRNGLYLLKGSVASGEPPIDTCIKHRLFKVKGKRMPEIQEYDEDAWSKLTDGDVAVLDAGSYIFLWVGDLANDMEKIKGVRVAQKLKEDYGEKCHKVIVIESNKENLERHFYHINMSSEERDLFNQFLDSAQKNAKHLDEKEIKKEDDVIRTPALKLYRGSEESGVTEIKEGPIYQGDLNSETSFIVDSNVSGVWVWIGKKAPKKDREEAIKNGMKFCRQKSYPIHTQVTRVIDSSEPLAFRSLFKFWVDPNQMPAKGRRRVSTMKGLDMHSANLGEDHVLASQIQMVDDGTEEKKVFLLKSAEAGGEARANLMPVEDIDYGHFFSGDCFIVVYQYRVDEREITLLYHWVGADVTEAQNSQLSRTVLWLDRNRFEMNSVLIRVVEGKETAHFTALFGGKMTVFKGSFRSSYRTVGSHSEPGDKYLLRVHGTNRYVTRALEVECVSKSLDTKRTFVFNTEDAVYLWIGKGTSQGEKEMGEELASRSKGWFKKMVVVPEGQEPEAFWLPLGGKGEYNSDEGAQALDYYLPPRLLHCRDPTGTMSFQEIPHFTQNDLFEEDVMLLDTWDIIFIWMGEKCTQQERSRAMRIGDHYLRCHEGGRDSFTPTLILKQGHEPATFTGFFGTWKPRLWEETLSYEAIKSQLNENHGKGG